jgi:hypothetical protein
VKALGPKTFVESENVIQQQLGQLMQTSGLFGSLYSSINAFHKNATSFISCVETTLHP